MKIGIVGYGSIGQRHAQNAEMLGHEIVVYDPLLRRDVKFERLIYEQCDAVVIATPSLQHPAGLRACAEHGKHVLIEKPIAVNSPYVIVELLALAERKNLVVMMGNNLRFHPCVQKAKAWIDAGHINKPIWAQFTCATTATKKVYRDDGVILNTGSHEVDIALYLFGPAKVTSANADHYLRAGTADSDINVVRQTDDIADFVLEHNSGVRSSFHLDFVTKNEIREAWIVGDRNIGLEFVKRRASLGDFMEEPGGSYDDDYQEEMIAFINRIEGGYPPDPGASGADGLATLRLLLDVRKMAGLP